MRRNRSGWFGQLIQRSNDGGKTLGAGRKQICVRRQCPGTHQWYDGTPHPWEFKRVWHLEPSLTDPDTVYAGIEDAALFRSTDGGKIVARTFRTARPRYGPALAAGSGRNVSAHDLARSERIPSEFSSRSRQPARFAPTTAGKHGGQSITAEVAVHSRPHGRGRPLRASHRHAQSRPNVLFMQKHWDVMRSDNAGDSWTRSAAICLPTSDL